MSNTIEATMKFVKSTEQLPSSSSPITTKDDEIKKLKSEISLLQNKVKTQSIEIDHLTEILNKFFTADQIKILRTERCNRDMISFIKSEQKIEKLTERNTSDRINTNKINTVPETKNRESNVKASDSNIEIEVDVIDTPEVDKTECFVDLESIVDNIRVKNEPGVDITDTNIKLEVPESVWSQTTNKKTTLRKHLHQCSICGKITERKHDHQRHLKRHMLSHPDKLFKCTMCDHLSTSPTEHQNHITDKHEAKPFKCSECDYTAFHEHYLQKHIRRSHTVDKPHKCTLCSYASTFKSDLKRHMDVHAERAPKRKRGEKQHMCTLCVYSAAYFGNLRRHFVTNHPGFDFSELEAKSRISETDGDTTCDKCSKDRSTLPLENTTEGHSPQKSDSETCQCSTKPKKSFECTICEFTTTRILEHQRHMSKHGVKRYQCTICPFSTSFSSTLKHHIMRHDDKRRFLCSTCGHAYKNKSSLAEHMRKHTGQKRAKPIRFKCTFCDYASANRSTLKTHLKIHTKEKPFLCSICGHASRQAHALVVHMRTHTGEKPFKCDLCDYAGVMKADVKRHHRIKHLQIKSYKCSVCDYAGSTSVNLRVHMRRHTGEKPFKCEICGYASRLHTSYKDHMRRHSGERPFKCSLCDYAAITQKGLSKHVKTHLRRFSQTRNVGGIDGGNVCT